MSFLRLYCRCILILSKVLISLYDLYSSFNFNSYILDLLFSNLSSKVRFNNYYSEDASDE